MGARCQSNTSFQFELKTTISSDKETDSEGILLNFGKVSFRYFAEVIEKHVRIIDSNESEDQKLLKLLSLWDVETISKYLVSLRKCKE